MEKTICLVQWHYTDEAKAHNSNVVDVVKGMEAIDDVVLAVPDVSENRALEKYAKRWGVEIFYGDTLDVSRRLLDAARRYGSKYIVRPSIDWFYMDAELVTSMIDKLRESGADFVTLPLDMDLRFGADVFTVSYLEKLLELFEADPKLKEKYQFHPYACAELTDFFKIEYFDIETLRSPDGFYPIHEKMKSVWFGEGTDYSDRPVYSYEHAARFIDPGDVVLDIACGTGFGTAILAKKASHVLGVDIEDTLISKCAERFAHLGNVEFRCGDSDSLDLADGKFDKIVSLHTMEHIVDNEAFLLSMRRLLKPDGLFVLEVPIFTRSIFDGITTPLNPFHVLEYAPDSLKELCSKYFCIEEVFGVNRGFYTTEGRLRNAMMLVLGRKSE